MELTDSSHILELLAAVIFSIYGVREKNRSRHPGSGDRTKNNIKREAKRILKKDFLYILLFLLFISSFSNFMLCYVQVLPILKYAAVCCHSMRPL
jgi:hypothetical protein